MSHSNNNESLQLPDLSQLTQELQPTLLVLEDLRQEFLRKKAKALNISLVIGVIGLVITSIVVSIAQSGFVFFIGAIFTGMVILVYRQFAIGDSLRMFLALFKAELYTRLTAAIAPKLVFQPQFHRSETELQETGLISSRIDRYRGQDQFSGHLGQTALVFSEVHAERRETTRDSKGHTRTRWVTVFRGIFLTADFHKHFTGEVLIESDIAEATFGWLGRKLQGMSGDLVRLENPEFENAFKVRASDQVEARYLLTPTMQERLLELKKTWGKGIMVALKAGRVHLLIPKSTDWFECNPELAPDNQGQLEQFSRQLISILKIIEELDLNTRLWTKE